MRDREAAVPRPRLTGLLSGIVLTAHGKAYITYCLCLWAVWVDIELVCATIEC